jgi:hypothetical protein
MTTIVTRLTGGTAKNAPLTNTELDNNFINLNTDKVEASANIITLSGTGAIKVPAGTTAEQPTPVDGMIRFNSDTPAFEGYKLGAWSAIGGGGGARGGSTDDVFYENSQIITTSYTVTSGKNAMSTGPITINSGAEVTIPLGSRWIVL